MAQLLITEDYLKKTTPIGDNVDMKVITPDIEWVQDAFIRPLLGQDLYERVLLETTPSQTLSDEIKALVDDFVLKVMRWYITAEAVRSLKYRFTNVGVMVSTSTNGTAIDAEAEKREIDKWCSRAERYAEMMQDFIYENQGDYPEYWTVSGVYRERPRYDVYDSPLSFGSTAKKRFYYTEVDKRFDSKDYN